VRHCNRERVCSVIRLWIGLWQQYADHLANLHLVGVTSSDNGFLHDVRRVFGDLQSGAGRYVYEGAAFWLILLAGAARDLPWRGTWRPALAACLFLACFSSSVLLFSFAAAKGAQMQRAVADLQALASERSDPCLDAGASVDAFVMPQVSDPATYYRATARYGDPVAGIPLTDRADFDRARRNLARPGCS